LGYRGTNLLWGIQTLLSTIEPGLTAKAKEMATDMLKKPFISDSIFSKFAGRVPVLRWFTNRWKLASAITSQELVRSLSHLAHPMTATSDGKTTADLIMEVLTQVNPEADRKAKMVSEVLGKLSSNITVPMDKVVQELEAKMQVSIGKVEAWFDTIMKRTSQRFTSQMRIWTIVFAFVFAFGAHLDSFNIFQKLWSSPGLVSSLVSDKDAILREASIVLSAQDGTVRSSGPSVAPQILADAMKKLIEEEKSATAGLGAVPRFNNLDDAVTWLWAGLKVEESRKGILVAAYKKLVLTELKGHAERIKQELEKSGFPLQIPRSWKDLINYDGLSILGILVTAGFLSLGAPFWFNTLGSLSNLRPLLANASTKTAT
jgi:hypothetical protein